jgi:hypothetical protein
MIGAKNKSEKQNAKAVKNIALLIVVHALYFSCTTDSEKPSDELYFPLQVGTYWVYDVEETATSRLTCTDNGESLNRYELKVVVTDSFPNAETEGGYSYILTRYTRSEAAQSWQPIATWTSKRVKSKAVNNESNILYLKLVFPLYEAQMWNGNIYNKELQLNGQIEDEYTAALVGKPYYLANGQMYPNTVTVLQNDEQKNILYRDSRLEVYALNVGLIYKESYLLKYFANSQLPCYGQNRVQQGSIWKQTLKEFGRN